MLRRVSTASGSTISEPALVNEVYDRLLGQPVRQASTIAKPAGSGDEGTVYGNIRDAYTNVDRVGLAWS